MDIEKFSIIIFESLKENETKTGFNLYETLRYYNYEENSIWENEYINVSNKKELLDNLFNLYKRAVVEKKFFILHFEVHGNENGIKLNNDEFICWNTIIPYFRSLNVLYQNNLTIHLAICKGISLLKYTSNIERAPFGLVFGSFKDISEDDIIKTFDRFYSKLKENISPKEAIELIQHTDDSNLFSYITSNHILKLFLEIEKDKGYSNTIDEDYFLMNDLS